MINQNNKKIFLETYGCQMNEADTEIIRAVLAKDNFEFVKDELAADVIMLNTCAIRMKEEERMKRKNGTFPKVPGSA